MPNIVVLDGRPTKDPEVRYTPKGTKILQFSVAVNRVYKPNGSDEWKEEVSYFDVEAFGNLAERLEEKLKKGVYILLEGNLVQDRWENEKGEKRSKVKVRANKISILGQPKPKEEVVEEAIEA